MSVLEQALSEMVTKKRVIVRNLGEDFVPPALNLGFRALDREWTWVAAVDHSVVAALVAAPCHGMVFLVRLAALPGCGWTLPRLFRGFIREVLQRGFQGYFTYLDPTRTEERKLLAVLKKAGAVDRTDVQVAVGGSLLDLARW